METDNEEKEEKQGLLQRVALAEENIELLDSAAATCKNTTLYTTCHQAVDLAIANQNYIEY